jgi:outer membrane immunogenic protein
MTGECLSPPISLSGIQSNGFIAGFQAGYNQQWANWVGGLEIDLSGTDIKGSTSTSAANAIFESGEGTFNGTHAATMQDKFALLGSVRARVGYLILPDLLLYGTGGVAFTRFTQSTTETLTAAAPPGSCCNESEAFSNSITSWRFGWAAGAGGEYRLWGSNWLARVEYLHYDFGNSGSSSTTETFQGEAPFITGLQAAT